MRTSSSVLVLFLLNTFTGFNSASCGHRTSLLRRKATDSKCAAGGEAVTEVEVGKFGYIAAQGPYVGIS
jgi:hypothetical protein